MREWLRHPLTWRISLGAYLVCLVGLILAYFAISLQHVRWAVYMQAPEVLVRGAPNASRGLLMSAETGQIVARVHAASLHLARGGQTWHLADVAPGPSGAIHTQLVPPPELEPGDDYELVFRARVAAGDDPFEARAPITLAAAPPDAGSDWPARVERMPEKERARTYLGYVRGEGPVRVDVIPAQPVLPRGLPGRVWLRTVDRATGAPRACTIHFDNVHGSLDHGELPAQVTTDELGLTSLEASLATTHQWKLRAVCGEELDAQIGDLLEEEAPDEEDTSAPEPESADADDADDTDDADAEPGEPEAPPGSRATIQVGTAATQLSVRTREALAGPGEDVELGVYTLFARGGFYVDLYQDDRWVWAGSFGVRGGRGGGRLELPEELVGARDAQVYRAQVFHDIYMPGAAWDVAHIASAPADGADADAALDAAILRLLERHAAQPERDEERARGVDWLRTEPGQSSWRGADGEQRRALLAALLAEIPSHHDRPPALLNSRDADERALEAWKDQVREDLLALIALALLVGVGVLALVVMWGVQQARRRQQLYQEVDLELASQELSEIEGVAEVDEAAVHRSGRLARAMALIQGAVIVGTLVVFAASLVLMLRLLM